MLAVRDLRLMQEGFRHPVEEVASMARYARTGRFNLEMLQAHDPTRTNLIAITQFEDGVRYIRDGFHRAMAVFIGRPGGELFDDEYFIEQLTYKRMNTANFGCAYYTPFDPRIEVRAADFGSFRSKVEEIEQQADQLAFIAASRAVYTRPKQAHHETVEAFATAWLAKNPKFHAPTALVADIR